MRGRTLSNEQAERFKRLVLPCLVSLVRTARFMCRREQEADDLVQEPMLKALQHFESLRQEEGVRAWLLTIQRRVYVDRCRGEKRQAPTASHEGLIEAAPAPPQSDGGAFDDCWKDPQHWMERFDDDDVAKALQSLPQEIRWTLLLVDVEGMDHAQAAEVLAVPVGTIKSRAHRGRAMLRDRLFGLAQRRGGSPPKQERPL